MMQIANPAGAAVDHSVFVLTRLLYKLGQEANPNMWPPADNAAAGSDSVDAVVGRAINSAFQRYHDRLETVYADTIRMLHQQRPPFFPGERVARLWSEVAPDGNESIVLDVDNVPSTLTTARYTIMERESLVVVSEEHIRMRPLALYDKTVVGQTHVDWPQVCSRVLLDEPAHDEQHIITEHGRYTKLLCDAAKAADKIHELTPTDAAHQKENAKKTRDTIIREILDKFENIWGRMREHDMVYEYGQFYRLI